MDKAPNNIKQLRDDLLKVYADLRSGRKTAQEVKEVNNTARAVISSCKVQLMYSKQTGAVPSIAFLED
jgi:hypothetical protein